ncbi:M23 family metallopeptidase [Candidatus Magnetobacterium casense]|uniref:Peptidoglycan DD-metalloendopeptidase family protein n=1 Tax=Candidatus Magnetobacterium casense TaxID=1455061 RepID=A0ABS6RWE4_9BACT|nr:M23 family metallopeptidase [Candidatus Magnetobacterium casensis]MBV6340113.1 peptidoglycan DD-metalloendopeptidase family protein [Candidatus Magnetobacterium casensis]
MALTKITENKTYNPNPLLSGAVQGLYQLGATLPAPRSPKVIQPQFPNLSNLAQFGQMGAIPQMLQQQQPVPAQTAPQPPAGVTRMPQQGATPTANMQMGSNPFQQIGSITTPYGGSTRYEGFHPGLDIANKIGTNVPAFFGGTVTGVRSGQMQGSPSFGNYVTIKDANGNTWRYSHLHDSYVKVGQLIQPGQVIGAMGNTGQTYSTSGGTGSHLDLRIYDTYQRYINPYEYYKKLYA